MPPDALAETVGVLAAALAAGAAYLVRNSFERLLNKMDDVEAAVRDATYRLTAVETKVEPMSEALEDVKRHGEELAALRVTVRSLSANGHDHEG